MVFRSNDRTIFALSTAQALSAISVIRISGSLAHDAARWITNSPLPRVRELQRRRLVNESGDTIDDAMIAIFAEGASYTGQRMSEIHCHGGMATTAAVLNLLQGQPGLFTAEPGEFTWRAFESGRISVEEAEGLGDLIAAETENQRRLAIRLASGEGSDLVENWRSKLLRAIALLEVTIDWVDEEVPENVRPDVDQILHELLGELIREREQSVRTERLRQGVEVALIGAPNSGKSTLLNYLAGREAALTSATPGTTRDIIEVRYDLDGWPLIFLDTAGLRDTDNELEGAGINRALERAKQADVRFYLRALDSTESPLAESLLQPGDFKVWAKSDLARSKEQDDFEISAYDGQGVAKLLRALADCLSASNYGSGLLSHHRHREALTAAIEDLRDAKASLEIASEEILSQKLRLALLHLEQIIGHTGVEDVLETIFGNFCLGK
ncbi:MAG: tRNA uridine-5-carboxymethylaminomethyl(34) synthesis GTPase MnmE [Pseudomonadota bacterium]